MNFKEFLEEQLHCWAAWVSSIHRNEAGWPQESLTYRLLRSGGVSTQPQRSITPIRVTEMVCRLNGLINQLQKEHPTWSEAIYLQYTVRIKYKDLADEIGIAPRTLRKRVQQGKYWLAKKI